MESVNARTSLAAPRTLIRASEAPPSTARRLRSSRTSFPSGTIEPCSTDFAPTVRPSASASSRVIGDGSVRARCSTLMGSTARSAPTPSRLVLTVTTRSRPSRASVESPVEPIGVTAMMSALASNCRVFPLRCDQNAAAARSAVAAMPTTNAVRLRWRAGATAEAGSIEDDTSPLALGVGARSAAAASMLARAADERRSVGVIIASSDANASMALCGRSAGCLAISRSTRAGSCGGRSDRRSRSEGTGAVRCAAMTDCTFPVNGGAPTSIS